jgi:GGDEF domain-containing protein
MERRLWGNIASLLGMAKPRAAAANGGNGDERASADPERPDRASLDEAGSDRTGRDEARAETRSAGPIEPETRIEFGQRLNAAKHYGEAITAGRIKLIDFDEIKRDFGPRWPEVVDRVIAAVTATLRQRLGSQDSFIRLDDAHFVLLFGPHAAGHAAAVCSLVAAEIKQKLFGIDRDLDTIKLATATVRVDGGVALDPVDPIATLTTMLDAAPAVTEHPPVAEASRRVEAEALAWREYRMSEEAGSPRAFARILPVKVDPCRLGSLLQQMARSIGDWRQSAPPPERVIYDGAEARRQLADSARRQQTVRLFEAAASGATQPFVAAGEEGRDPIMSQLRGAAFRYQPIWHRDTQAITSYGLSLRFLVGDAYLSLGEIMEWESDPEVVVAVDLMIVRKGLADLAAMLRNGTKAILSLPLHRAALELPLARGQLLSILSDAPRPMQQLILLDVLDAYAGDWTLLPALVAGLKRVSRDVVLRLSLDHANFARVRAAGAQTVGGDLRDHPWSHGRAVNALAVFGKAARAAGLQSYVLGLEAPPLAAAAIAAGFDYMAGSAVAPEIPEPLGVLPLDAASIVPPGAILQS